MYQRPRKKKQDTFKNWPLMKNLHFLSYPHETLWKWSPHKWNIFTKFHKVRTKDVVFIFNFWMCLIFFFRLYINITRARYVNKTVLDTMRHLLANLCIRLKFCFFLPIVSLASSDGFGLSSDSRSHNLAHFTSPQVNFRTKTHLEANLNNMNMWKEKI